MTETWIEKDGVIYGARPDERGPIGGGAGYRDVITSGDVHVRTIDELVDALAAAVAGQTVFVAGDAVLDFTELAYLNELPLKVAAGVTLASDRGWNGSPGAMLCSDAMQTSPLILITGIGVRISGLRLRGPDPKRRLWFHNRVFGGEGGKTYDSPDDAYYALPNSDAIHTDHDNLELDNCEVAAWSHAGAYLRHGVGHRVHHCDVHHIQRMGLGYGICMNHDAEAVITFNQFQDNKHHIAGTGSQGQCYEAAHNVVLPYTEDHAHPVTGKPYGQDHLFDMHGGRDRVDQTNIAGKQLSIHHNTFIPAYNAINIRGEPQEAARIQYNWFVNQIEADAVIGEGNVQVASNWSGPAPTVD